jgi:simple sugar transport system permease protein
MAILTNPELWVLTVAMSVPIAYGALGGMFSERGGTVNIAIEGMMLTSAFFAVVFAHSTMNPWLGLLGGIVSSVLMAVLLYWAAVPLVADHVVVGMAVDLLALGLTGYLLVTMYGYNGTPINTPSLPTWHFPWLSGIPVIGPALAEQSVLAYLLIPVLLASWYLLFRTPWGLRLRSVGENPHIARSAGLSVRGLKLSGVLISGVLAGVAGAYLSIGVLNSFTADMSDGRGYIALAALIFGNWRPGGATLAALLFGFATALSIQLQGTAISHNLVLMLPYLLTVVAVAGIIGRTTPPASDGLPYREEEDF